MKQRLVHLRHSSGAYPCVSIVSCSLQVGVYERRVSYVDCMQGYVSATCMPQYSSVPRNGLPMPTNSDAGMVRTGPVGDAQRRAVGASCV